MFVRALRTTLTHARVAAGRFNHVFIMFVLLLFFSFRLFEEREALKRTTLTHARVAAFRFIVRLWLCCCLVLALTKHSLFLPSFCYFFPRHSGAAANGGGGGLGRVRRRQEHGSEA
jgi:hypothetical protein